MRTLEYVIKDDIGIHARPAGFLVKEAKKYSSKIILNVNGKKADATKLISIMGLGVRQGQTVIVNIEGTDEDEAYENIKKFFEHNL